MTAVIEVPFTGFELPFEIIVIGLIVGLTYGLFGVAVSLTYRSSRVLNLAAGEMGAIAYALVAVLVLRYEWSYWIAVPVGLAAATATGTLSEVFVVRRLARAPRLIVLVATIGIAQVLLAIGLFIPQVQVGQNVFPTPFTARVRIGGLTLTTGHLLILAVVPAIAIALTVFLRRSRLGFAARAVAENLDAAKLAGVPARKVSLAVWTLAGLLSGLAAILNGPTQPVVNLGEGMSIGPQLLLRALGAAMIGGLVNVPAAFAGGIAIGVVEVLARWNYPTGNLTEVVLLGMIIVSLLMQRGLGQLLRGGEGSSWFLAGGLRPVAATLAALPAVKTFRRLGLVALVAAAALLPLLVGLGTRARLATVLLFGLMALSLVVLTGFAGQVSLGQFAFVGLGAVVGGRMAQLGYPPWVGGLYALAAGALAAIVIGLPALRLRGLFLAVTTLGFAVASSSWLFAQGWLVRTDNDPSLRIPRPTWGGIDFESETNYYWLCLAALILAALAVHRIRVTGIGRTWMAVRDNEAAAASLGVSPRGAKLSAFAISGMLASGAGYLYGGLLVAFADVGAIFGSQRSIELFTLAIVGGVTTVTGAVMGALFVHLPPIFLHSWLGSLVGPKVAMLLAGLGVLSVVLQFPNGLAGAAFHGRDRIVASLARRFHPSAEGEPETAPAAAEEVPREPRIVTRAADRPTALPSSIGAEDIVVRFGGVVALDHVSMYAAPGEIVGLVGPNGAGKTTLFDVFSGQVRPDEGRIVLDGVDITHLRPEQRARRSLARSFQQARLFDGLSLLDTFKVALESSQPSELVPSILALGPSREAERQKQVRAEELVELVGLDRFADHPVAELSTGTRRMAELGTVVGLGARAVLLDEPTAGLAQGETDAMAAVLRDLRDQLDATFVVIEHNIPVLMRLVDRMYVLASGRMIAEGAPAAVGRDPAVLAAYFGPRAASSTVADTQPPDRRPAGVLAGSTKRGGDREDA